LWVQCHIALIKQLNGWFLSCTFAIPLRSILWQKCNLKTTIYRGVTLWESGFLKLIKAILIEHEIDGTIFNETIEMEPDSIDTLKAKGNEIARALDTKEIIWSSRYPVMGDSRIEDIKEFQMVLTNGTTLEIRR
jgi:hypothetical protein